MKNGLGTAPHFQNSEVARLQRETPGFQRSRSGSCAKDRVSLALLIIQQPVTVMQLRRSALWGPKGRVCDISDPMHVHVFGWRDKMNTTYLTIDKVIGQSFWRDKTDGSLASEAIHVLCGGLKGDGGRGIFKTKFLS